MSNRDFTRRATESQDDDENGERKKRARTEISGAPEPNYFVFTNRTIPHNVPKDTMTHLRVDTSVYRIPAAAFEDCRSLVQVQLPCTLINIGEFAFQNCRNLRCIQFLSNTEDGSVVLSRTNKRLEIDRRAFSRCCGLTVELPEGLLVVAPRLFFDFGELNEVRIPSSVTLISEFAFSKTTLRSVTLPLGLQSIGADAFSGCELLEFIDVPPTVSAIGEGAFASCNVLKRIRLPPTLKIIEKYLFFKCWWLEDIVIPDTVEQIHEYAFTNCGLLSHVRLPPGNTIVAYDAFECCQSLISLETPRRGAVFDFRALMGCCSLVNFFQSSQQHRSVYLNHSKLAKLADSGADLLQKLKHRFDECPLARTVLLPFVQFGGRNNGET